MLPIDYLRQILLGLAGCKGDQDIDDGHGIDEHKPECKSVEEEKQCLHWYLGGLKKKCRGTHWQAGHSGGK